MGDSCCLVNSQVLCNPQWNSLHQSCYRLHKHKKSIRMAVDQALVSVQKLTLGQGAPLFDFPQTQRRCILSVYTKRTQEFGNLMLSITDLYNLRLVLETIGEDWTEFNELRDELAYSPELRRYLKRHGKMPLFLFPYLSPSITTSSERS